MARSNKIVLALLAALISAGALSVLFFYSYCNSPAAGSAETFITIPRGSSLKTIARLLAEKQVVDYPALFRILVVMKKSDAGLKSGEYFFAKPLTPLDVLEKLTRGEVLTHPVTIPEGSSLTDIAALIEAAGFCSAEAVLAESGNTQLLRKLGLESGLEGFLFPDTYRFSRHTDPAAIITTLARRCRSVLRQERSRAAHSSLSDREVIILASLVEKETARTEEKPLVAAVFLNRLKKNMRLECDPTVIYGVRQETPDFTGRLRTRHLRKKTPYNTYVIKGLPKGPICSPGREAIRAVFNPADVDYLFFVSRNDGTHRFSRTLREHSRAVDRYQRNRR